MDIRNDEHVIVLNDQGGQSLNVSKGVSGCLRAQEHGHQPVICFEPGIMSRDCQSGNRANFDICPTLRANCGDNKPAVCYENTEKTVFIDLYNGTITGEKAAKMGSGGG